MKKGAITFLDVIGWKKIWERMDNPTERLIRLNGFATAIGDKVRNGRFQRLSEHGLSPNIQGLSDMIVIWTFSENPLYALELHAEIATMLIVDSMIAQIPLRGATAYGEFYVAQDYNIMVGAAVDDAAEWYDSFRMIGVVQTPSADEQLSNLLFKRPHLLVDYSIPKKTNGSVMANCINWPHRWQLSPKRREDLELLLCAMEQLAKEDDKRIYRNTIEFYDYVFGQPQ